MRWCAKWVALLLVLLSRVSRHDQALCLLTVQIDAREYCGRAIHSRKFINTLIRVRGGWGLILGRLNYLEQ